MLARKKVLHQVEDLLKNYCEGCLLHRVHVQEGGRRYAHRFCIKTCTVGEKIRLIGSQLHK